MIAKDSNGKLYSWGDNDYGQLGDGTTTDSSMPICISDIENSPLREKNIVKIYREENSIIVKDSSGKLYTWGENDYGQLGDGTTTNSSMPICISDMESSPLKGREREQSLRHNNKRKKRGREKKKKGAKMHLNAKRERKREGGTASGLLCRGGRKLHAQQQHVDLAVNRIAHVCPFCEAWHKHQRQETKDEREAMTNAGGTRGETRAGQQRRR